MKKIFAMLLVVMLCAAMVLPAYADPAPTGSLTIYNAEVGLTYHLVKVFDAETSISVVDGQTKTNVSYYLDKTKNPTLYALIAAGAASDIKNADGTTAVRNPFLLHDTDDENIFQVTHAEPVGEESKEFGRGWLYKQYNAGQWTLDETANGALADGAKNNVTFNDLTYGYYMIYKTDTTGTKGSIASVANVIAETNPIADKNPRSPGDPEKKVKIGSNDFADSGEIQVGDVVTYQASFLATNYRNYDTPVLSTKKITQYTIRDDAKGLKYKSLDSMIIYQTKDEETGTFSDPVPGGTFTWTNQGTDFPPYTADANYGGYSMVIPWVNAETGESLYPSPCYVVLTYQAYVTENVLNALNNNTATNTFTPMFRVEGSTTDVPLDNPPSVKVFTSGLSLMKTNSGGSELQDSKFILAKVFENDVEKFYHIENRTSEVTGETWKDIEWSDTKSAEDAVVASNNPDEQTFGGLSSGTYHLYEVETPDGYNFPGFDYWEVVISFNEETKQFSATIRPSNSETATELSPVPYKVGETTYYRNYFSATIVNEGGAALPTTGAAGTTMLLLVGGALFAVTMLFLVTKKRMYNLG